MPSVMAARSLGRNSGPVFRRLWTKVHQIQYTHAHEKIAVFSAVFRLTIPCFLSEIFATERPRTLD